MMITLRIIAITILVIISDMTTPQPLVKSLQCSQNITRQEYIGVSSFSAVSIFFTFDDLRIMIIIIIKTSGPVCKHLRERPQAREASCVLWPATNTRQIFDTLLKRTFITINKFIFEPLLKDYNCHIMFNGQWSSTSLI